MLYGSLLSLLLWSPPLKVPLNKPIIVLSLVLLHGKCIECEKWNPCRISEQVSVTKKVGPSLAVIKWSDRFVSRNRCIPSSVCVNNGQWKGLLLCHCSTKCLCFCSTGQLNWKLSISLSMESISGTNSDRQPSSGAVFLCEPRRRSFLVQSLLLDCGHCHHWLIVSEL